MNAREKEQGRQQLVGETADIAAELCIKVAEETAARVRRAEVEPLEALLGEAREFIGMIARMQTYTDNPRLENEDYTQTLSQVIEMARPLLAKLEAREGR